MTSITDRLHKRRHKAVTINDGADTVYLRALIGSELRALMALPPIEQDAAYIALALVNDEGVPLCPKRDDETYADFAARSFEEMTGAIPIDTRAELLEELNKLQRPPSQRSIEKN